MTCDMDKQTIIMHHLFQTWDCFLCEKLGLKEKCEKAGAGCNNNFLEKEIRKIFSDTYKNLALSKNMNE